MYIPNLQEKHVYVRVYPLCRGRKERARETTFHGGCEKRGVAMCDIVFIISPHWDVLNAIACTFSSAQC